MLHCSDNLMKIAKFPDVRNKALYERLLYLSDPHYLYLQCPPISESKWFTMQIYEFNLLSQRKTLFFVYLMSIMISDKDAHPFLMNQSPTAMQKMIILCNKNRIIIVTYTF